MKYSALTLLLFCGCAPKKQTKLAIPGKCIRGAVIDRPSCKPTGNVYICNGVAIDAVCLEVKK